MDVCPVKALKIAERPADPFEEEEVKRFARELGGNGLAERAARHFLDWRRRHSHDSRRL